MTYMTRIGNVLQKVRFNAELYYNVKMGFSSDWKKLLVYYIY